MKCCICGKNKPDGPRWIYVAGGMAVCSVECEYRRLQKLTDAISKYLNNHGDDIKVVQ
jgi:hypothetical protein